MPLKLIDTASDSEIVLENIEFIEENNVHYFRVSNDEEVGVKFQYIPIAISNWNTDCFEVFLLENPYLCAENDVFEVYEDTISDERLGWIFPITILESNENDFKEYKNLNHYKYIAFKKLLELNIKISAREKSNEFMRLSEVFGDIIICVLCKETTVKIANFNFENYLLSLYKYGYLLLGDIPKSKPIYDRSDFVRDMRERKRVNLTKAKFDITTNEFIKSLFKEHLLQSENFLIRFIFLYQIIEYFIQLEFDSQFQGHLDDYNNHRLTKNDLRENIINSSKERELIKSIINQVSIRQELKDEFISECNFLFSDIGLISKDTFPDKIYDLRNILTHRLRDLTTKTETLKKITEIFERIIIELLTNHETINTIDVATETV